MFKIVHIFHSCLEYLLTKLMTNLYWRRTNRPFWFFVWIVHVNKTLTFLPSETLCQMCRGTKENLDKICRLGFCRHQIEVKETRTHSSHTFLPSGWKSVSSAGQNVLLKVLRNTSALLYIWGQLLVLHLALLFICILKQTLKYA